MGFYPSPSFFMALATAVVPAAVLGFMERRIKYYGFAASCVMVGLLFAGSPAGAAAFAVFLAVAFASMRATLASWKRSPQRWFPPQCSASWRGVSSITASRPHA